MIVLVEIAPLNRATNLRTTLRISSSQIPEALARAGLSWTPAITDETQIVLTERAFNGTFAEAVEVPSAQMSINVGGNLKALDGTPAAALNYHSASATIYAAESATQTWPWPVEFMGRITGVKSKGASRNLSLSVNELPFKKTVLSTYTGGGLINGDADLKGQPIPWLFGTAQNVEPVLINAVNIIYQFSGYGPIKSVLKLYERGSDEGASFGDYPSYAALVAAALPSDRWATCNALGLVRRGAPAFGVITGDVEGDFFGGVFRTRPGAILQRIAAHLGITANLNTVSLDAFDTHQATRPAGGHNDYLASQSDFLSIAQDLCRKNLGQAMLSRKTGKLGVCRPTIGAALFTMDSQGVFGVAAQPASESETLPYARVQLSGVRSWRVHTADEIASADLTVDFATQVTGAEKPANNADVTTDQAVVSRINPTTGNALDTFAAPDGLPFNRVVASGEARNGDVITFSLPSIPKITFGVGGNAATAGQNIVISDVGTTATGFTMRAVSQAVTPGTTYTDGGATAGSGAEPSWVINRTNGGAAFDGRFVFRYSVTVGTISPGEPGVIEIGIYIKRSGSWIQVGSGMHGSSGTYSVAVTPGTVDFGAGNEFGISVLYSEGRPADPTSLNSFLDVVYTTGTVVETSLTPAGASPIKWEARL
jgi:hypothetical protein